MSRITNKLLPLLTLLFVTGACHKKNDVVAFAADENTEAEPVEIVRLDKVIEGYITLDSVERVATMEKYSDLLKGYALFVEGNDRIDNTSMALWSTWPATVMFMPEVNKVFTDLEPESQSFATILATADANDIKLPARNFVTVTWGDPRSLMVMYTISTAYVALNHYLGPENEAYRGWPQYKRALKTRPMIPVDVAEALVSISMPYTPKNRTILSRLLYEGALAVAKQAFVPDASLSMILGLTESDLSRTRENEDFIWKMLIKDNNLYSTDAELMSNLFDFLPSSGRISPDAPGRAARYIGYRIVTEYIRQNPDVELKYLLSPDFYDDGTTVLRKSGYSPVSSANN